MDPNENLRRLRALVESSNTDNVLQTPREAEIVDLFEALDQWITNGGFIPDDWAKRLRTSTGRV
jgi:hypothetical protein